MFGRKNKDDDDLGPSKGLVKLMHKTVMFILWPLRRPLWFLLIVAILFLAPTFRGVKPAEVHLWYWNHIKQSSSEVGTLVSDKTKKIMPNLPKVELPAISVKSTEKKAVPAVKVVDMPQKESRRKMFEKAKSAPIAMDIMQQAQPSVAPQVAVSAQTENKPDVETPKTLKGIVSASKKLSLLYLNEPKFIYGNAEVVNANELKINNENIFLYGVYVDPNSDKGKKAQDFLMQTIKNRMVNCRIEAYSHQGVATAICIVDGINLNKVLVENGYSKNVALD